MTSVADPDSRLPVLFGSGIEEILLRDPTQISRIIFRRTYWSNFLRLTYLNIVVRIRNLESGAF
jgi:hypothetical protein